MYMYVKFGARWFSWSKFVKTEKYHEAALDKSYEFEICSVKYSLYFIDIYSAYMIYTICIYEYP